MRLGFMSYMSLALCLFRVVISFVTVRSVVGFSSNGGWVDVGWAWLALLALGIVCAVLSPIVI